MCRCGRSLDKDRDGVISKEELEKAIQGLGMSIGDDIAGKMVQLIDADNSSDVSFEEFRRFALMLPASQVRHCDKFDSC